MCTALNRHSCVRAAEWLHNDCANTTSEPSSSLSFITKQISASLLDSTFLGEISPITLQQTVLYSSAA